MNLLVNLSTVTSDGVIPYWLKKFQLLSKHGHNLDLFINNKFISIDFKNENIYQFNQRYLNPNPPPVIKNKFIFIFYSIYCNLRSFIQTNKTSKYDLIYTPSSVLDMVLWPFLIKKIYPNIGWATVFDNIVPLKDPGNPFIRVLAWIFFHLSLSVIKSADYIFAISPELKDYLIKKGFDSRKILVTGNGIETDLIKQAKPSAKYHFDALFIGRINETKGIFDMLQVLKILKIKYPKFQLGIMGRGDNATETKFRNQIKKLKLKSNVQLLGYISGIKKFEIIKSSKSFWFLSLSLSESFGIALLEAVASGVYGFVYNLPTFKNIYQNQEVFFSPLHDVNHVANNVEKLFKSSKFFNKNGKKLLNKYSWESIVTIENKAINSFKK